MKPCQRCNDKSKCKIMTACGVIRLCGHCSRAWWAMLTGRDGLSEVIRAD